MALLELLQAELMVRELLEDGSASVEEELHKMLGPGVVLAQPEILRYTVCSPPFLDSLKCTCPIAGGGGAPPPPPPPLPIDSLTLVYRHQNHIHHLLL